MSARKFSASNPAFMSSSNRRSVKTLVSAAFLAFGLILFVFQFSAWDPRHMKAISSLENSRETALAHSIPEKIWYKVGPKGINEETQGWINTCLDKNPSFEHEILTDSTADAYIVKNFAHRLDIVETYLALAIPILKADLLRYLLLYSHGGIWSDLDVSCGDTPIRDWIPQEFKNSTSLVVGWEFQTVDEKHMREFVTWMIMSEPGSRHMAMAIDDILDALHAKAKEHEVSISGLTMAMIGDIVWLTGPMAMSKSIIKSLGIEDQNVNYGTTAYVFEPQLFDDVLVLPGYSFSASLQSYKDHEKPGLALVTHHFAGSWKNSNGGEAGDPVLS